MNNKIAHLSFVVRDYAEAIRFFTEILEFKLLEDTRLSETKRWVIVGPENGNGCNLLLAKAVGEEQVSRIGNQTGGRVFLFLHTDDFDRLYNKLIKGGIRFVRPPSMEIYGKVAVFEDLYGNLWDLIEPIKA